ncbi:MAG TPA: hypothetical protein VKB47_12370 [Terracidiphilus sp.]|nr:hypothetical protein [Terracidiphilus sp.]
MNNLVNPQLAEELRFALDVMEEYSHLGLDDATASKLRHILLRRINEAEVARSSRPAAPVRFPISDEKILA